jgi:polynucleotide 5'-hydroxyl-kinase GRC3/NOL9
VVRIRSASEVQDIVTNPRFAAFEALQGQNMPFYEANTSDEEDVAIQDSITTSFQVTPEPLPVKPSTYIESKYICSNFVPDKDNVIFGNEHITVGLKVNQNLIIRGQFKLKIQRGAITVNNVVYHSSSPEMDFLNPISNSLPTIQATQVIDRQKINDTQTEENQHLFNSNYKSVIQIANLSTGLENIGNVCPVYKNIFWNVGNLSELEKSKLNQFEKLFSEYSFFPIISPTNSMTLINYRNWINDIQRLSESFSSTSPSLRILIIGAKNSGKSTLLKLLLQNFLNEVSNSKDDYITPINIMDLDPGQSEFSKPDSISLNKLTSNQFGNHLSLTSTHESINHFIGFSSPKDQPKRYGLLINDLIKRYNSDGLLKNETLLINTPGWIKGYGLNLTKELIEKLKPTHLIYLNPGNNNQSMDQSLEELNLDPSIEFLPLLGNYFNFSSGVIKYSSSQLRSFKTLAYFHKQDNLKFDFEKPLLFKAPLQVSYDEAGIKAVSILNVNGLQSDDLENSLTGTIVALHTVSKKLLGTIRLKRDSGSIPLIDSIELNKIDPVSLKFKSLALIHSINTNEKLINLYIPEFEHNNKSANEEYVLIRGNTETPIWELASRQIVTKFGLDLPFISFDKYSDFDKVWKVRKNVQRRGQLQ